MKHRLLAVMVFGALVVLATAVIAPAANAAMVTKTMYAEENTSFYSYTSTTTGHFNVTLSWGSPDGTGSFPQSEVDGVVQGPAPSYSDITPATLYGGTNPQLGRVPESVIEPDLAAGTYYFGVIPDVGDEPFHLVVTFTPSGGSATTVIDTTGMAYASDGRVYVPSDGDWISCVQQWAGTGASYSAVWSDNVQQSVAGSPFDILSNQFATTWVPPQTTERNTIGGGVPHPNAGEWYSVTPQILYSAAQPVTVPNPGTSLVPPGSIVDTAAPAWYTYAYPDASQTTQKMDYFFSTAHTTQASKRNYSGNTSTNASVSFKFYGETLDWYYVANPYGCKANVTIDGVAPTSSQGPAVVDQSAASYVYGAGAAAHYTGLGAGYHTITVSNSGQEGDSHTASVSTRLLTHDAFFAADGPSSPPSMHENNYDGSTTYQFSTATVPGNPNPAPHGGTYSGSTSTNDAVACYFKGSSIDFYYVTTPYGCLANVLIDGQPPSPSQGLAVIDQSSSGYNYLVKSAYSGLANTTHIILIYNSGLKGAYHVASPSTRLFTVDAFNYTPPDGPTVWVDDK